MAGTSARSSRRIERDRWRAGRRRRRITVSREGRMKTNKVVGGGRTRPTTTGRSPSGVGPVCGGGGFGWRSGVGWYAEKARAQSNRTVTVVSAFFFGEIWIWFDEV